MSESEFQLKNEYEEFALYLEKDGRTLLAVFSKPFSETITVSQALEVDSGAFVFSSVDITARDCQDFLIKCQSLLLENKTKQGLIWLSQNEDIILNISNNFTEISKTFSVPISGVVNDGINIEISKGAILEIPQNQSVLKLKDKTNFCLKGTNAGVDVVSIILCGENSGSINVKMSSSNIDFNCGIEYGFTAENGRNSLLSSHIFSEPISINSVEFEFGFNVLHGNTMRFMKEFDEAVLCNFSSLYGDELFLFPIKNSGGISFLPRISTNVHSAPLGEYKITSKSGKPIKLLCGFSGTEYIEIENNSIIEFVPNCPAFSPFYPEKEFSISDFVEQQPKNLLTDEMVTSWIKFKGKYYSQSLEAPFFSGNGDVLLLADLYVDFSDASPAMPVMPYKEILIQPNKPDKFAAVEWADKERIYGFETSILTTERNNCTHENSLSNNGLKYFVSNSSMTAATPSGFIGEVSGNNFTKITIAFSRSDNLEFAQINNAVLAVFSSSSVFCVMAGGSNTKDFKGKFAIDDWNFNLSPGEDSSYDNYANIIIIKGMQGKIYDPENAKNSFCANPNIWTCKESFSDPSAGRENIGKQANLANWLSNYCRDAIDKYDNGDKYYENFVKIITDENWKGFLALNVSLSAASFPDCLKPLLAGLPDVSKIRAHHIGSELVPLIQTETGPKNEGYSPFFGLIRYSADGFYGSAMPVDEPSAEYEFKLLEMNVLFKNGTVEKFNSLSQLVVNNFMELKPSAGGCLYNAILLNGSLQSTNGHSVLMMNSNGGEFVFENMPILKTEINGVTVISVNPDKNEFTFDLSGYMSFQKPLTKYDIDVFSFDKFLFTSYKINLDGEEFSLDLSKMSFDFSNSKVRDESFCKTFGLVPSAAITSIAKDYKAIAVENFKTGTLEKNVSGIEFSVNFGELGSLSSGSSLNSKIVLAWDAKGNNFVGIKLPGATLIDGVIGINLGDVRLTTKGENKDKILLLYISKVALQLLGMLKLPPNGALNLAFTGNDEGIGWFAAYKKDDKKKDDKKKKGVQNVPL